MRLILFFILIIGLGCTGFAQETQYETRKNIHYYSDSVNQSASYISERCVLDVYYPKNIEHYATVVWFHGGGLTSGNKSIPKELKEIQRITKVKRKK